jgi:hypothetical protein
MSLSLTALTIAVFLSPLGQSAINSWLKNKFINDFEVELSTGSLFVNPVGTTSFTDLLIRDHRNDTLVFVEHFSFESYSLGGLIRSKLHLEEVEFDSLVLNIVKYKNEDQSNLDIFIEKVKPDDAVIKELSAKTIKLNNSQVQFRDMNTADSAKQLFSEVNAKLVDLSSHFSDFSTQIEEMSFFADHQNIQVFALEALCSFGSERAEFQNLKIITPNSQFVTDVSMRYPKGGFRNFYDDVSIDAVVQNSFIGLEEFQLLVPNVFGSETIFLDQLNFSGTLSEYALDSIRINYEKSNFLGSFTINTSKDISKFTIKELLINPNDVQTLFPNLEKSSVDILKRFDKMNISGTLASQSNNHKLNLSVDSRLGPLQFNFDFNRKGKQMNDFYDGQIRASQFNLGSLLNQPDLGITDALFNVQGKGLQFDQLDTKLNGHFSSFSYHENNLDSISVDINLNKNRVFGLVDINDNDAKLQIQGQFETNDSVQKLSAIVKVSELKLQSIQSSKYLENRTLSGNFEIVGQGTQMYNFIGDINAVSVQIRSKDKLFSFEDFSIQSRVNKDLRFFNIRSDDVANGLIYGRFEFSDLNKMIKNSFGSYFSSYEPLQLDSSKFVNFSINFKEKLISALSDDIAIDDNSFFRGKLSANENEAALQFDIPYIQYEDKFFTQFRLTLDNDNPLYKYFIQIEEFQGMGLNLSQFQLINAVINDRLHFRAEYDSDSLHNEVNFYSTLDDNQEMEFGIQPSKISFQGKQWEVNQLDKRTSSLHVSSNGLQLDSTVFSNDESALHLSFDQQKTQRFQAIFENIDLSDIIAFKPKRDVSGITNGTLDITFDNDKFGGEANLRIDSLSLNDSFLGDASITLQSLLDAYALSFSTVDNDLKTSSIEGLIFPQSDNNLDLNATFHKFPAAFLDRIIGNALTEVGGEIDGSISIGGKWNKPMLEGELFLEGFRLSVPYLNVGYRLTDHAKLTVNPTSFQIEPTRLIDENSLTSANFGGSITHQNFDFFTLDMNLSTDSLLVLNTDNDFDNYYYGKAVLNGSAHIHGPAQSLTFDVLGQSAKGTNIIIPVDNTPSIEDVSYIRFVEKNRANISGDPASSSTEIKGLNLNFDLLITPDAELELVIDSDTGSTLSGSGLGSILMEVNTDGIFSVWGDFIGLNGAYSFKNLGILEKEFTLEPGGTIVWNGNPLDAELNLQATYEVPGGANPAILLENPGLNRKIPTDVKIFLSGSIMQPETPRFSIDFPNTSANVRNDLAYILDDEERRQIQAISLLSQGVFISDLSLSAISTQTLTNNLFQKASGVLESIFSGDEDKLKLGLDYLQGDRNAEATAQTRDRLGLTLVTQVSERLLINGKLGVPFGGVEETIIVGDVTIEFLLSKDGALRARIFNRENEFQYFGDDLGYTQGIGLSYRVGFDDFKSLIKKIIKKNTI